MSNIQYQDPTKNQLFDSIQQSSAQLTKIRESNQNAILATESANPSQAAPMTAKNTEEARILAEKEYENLVSEWRQKYPADRMFETMEAINFDSIQRKLSNNHAIIQYIPLSDQLVIMVITNTDIYHKTYPISYQELGKLITYDFLYDCIARFKKIHTRYDFMRVSYNQTNNILYKMTEILYNPIKDLLEGKDRLFIVTSKFISYVPFNALILDQDANIKIHVTETVRPSTRPKYLVDEKVISMVRLSFFDDSFTPTTSTQPNKNFLSIGNPYHALFGLVFADLPGAKLESDNIKNICDTKIADPDNNCVQLIGTNASRINFEEKLKNNSFGIVHFATHGEPFAAYESFKKTTERNVENKQGPNGNPDITLIEYAKYKLFLSYANNFFTNTSFFNGFLYFSSEIDDIISSDTSIKTVLYYNSFKKSYELNSANQTNELGLIKQINDLIPNYLIINPNLQQQPGGIDHGLLTIKQIIELNDNYFKEAYIGILSACYTAVNFAPNHFKSLSDVAEFTQKQTEAHQDELNSLGWRLGIEEICFVDIIMSKNFRYVTGNLWDAQDDAASKIILTFVDNIYNDNLNDPAVSFANAIRTYLNEPPPENINNLESTHPYFWALANIFGN
jgi:CHAT domain-containing protein